MSASHRPSRGVKARPDAPRATETAVPSPGAWGAGAAPRKKKTSPSLGRGQGGGDPLAWLEISTLAVPEAVEPLSEIFQRYGQGLAIEHPVRSSLDGDVVEMPAGEPLLVKTYVPAADPDYRVRAARIELAVEVLRHALDVQPPRRRWVRPVEWEESWKQHFLVHRVGTRLVIVPSWRREEYRARPEDVPLLLDPGMAFGTGLHPTTRLCLELLEQHVQPGQKVLDVGAGSGILSIAAARLGAGHVDAVEIDPVAATVCRANVHTNGVEAAVTVREGTLDGRFADGGYSLVLANITIRVLRELRSELWRVLRPGGTAIMSGVLADREGELTDELRADDWVVGDLRREGDWLAIAAGRGA